MSSKILSPFVAISLLALPYQTLLADEPLATIELVSETKQDPTVQMQAPLASETQSVDDQTKLDQSSSSDPDEIPPETDLDAIPVDSSDDNPPTPVIQTQTTTVVQTTPPPTKESSSLNILLEAKAAYFFPQDSRFNDVFGGAGIYGLELSVQAWRNLYGWFSVDTLYASGESYGTSTPSSTNMTLVPLGLGLKALYPVGFVDFWMGAGALGSYMHINQHSPYVSPSVSRWGAGGIIKGGILFHVYRGLIIDIFANYSFMTIPYSDSHGGTVIPYNANLNGGTLGASIGWSFGARQK